MEYFEKSMDVTSSPTRNLKQNSLLWYDDI